MDQMEITQNLLYIKSDNLQFIEIIFKKMLVIADIFDKYRFIETIINKN